MPRGSEARTQEEVSPVALDALGRELERLRALTALRLARLQGLTASLSEAVTPAEVARAAIEHVLGAVGAREGALWTLGDGGTAELLDEVGLSPDDRARFARMTADASGPLADALREGEAIWIESRAALARRHPGLTAAEGAPLALACLPMTVKGQRVGAMAFTFPAERPFDPEDRSFLLVAVRHAAQALERARLFSAEQQARAEAVAASARAAFLYEAGTLLSSSLEYEATLTSVARLAVPRVADWCSVDVAEDLAHGRGPVVVAHADAAKLELARELARRYPPDPEAARGAPAVIRTGRSELYTDVPDALLVASARDAEHLRLWRELGLGSAMVVPMTTRGRTLGAITFMAATAGRRYQADDLAMAEHLARRAALAIDNARLFEQAQEAVRAREEVVAIVSHDLKNPLNAILMSAGLLRRSAGDPERVQHHADAVERSVHRMRSLVRDLLDLARMDAGRFTLERRPEAIGPIAAEAVAVLQPLAQEKRLRLEAEPAVDEIRALCDRERLLQVFSNLLGNAIAFTPPGGRVAVRARRALGEVVVAVSDSGPGIPPDEQRLVFEPFWKSRSSRQGTGLGLSIVKGIVDAHGGRIWVESRPGAGAVFLFTLPAVIQPELPAPC